jgi:spermidine synthase
MKRSGAAEQHPQNVLGSYLRLLEIAFVGSGLLPLCIIISTRLMVHDSLLEPRFALKIAVALGALATVWLLLRFARRRWEPRLDTLATAQAAFLDQLPDRHVAVAIVVSAAVSLFLELAMIRWQTTVFALLSFYKNFGLLACFAGLGLGYSLAERRQVLLFGVVPTLGWQVGLLLFLRYGLGDLRLRSMMVSPVLEQANMSFGTATGPLNFVPIYLLLAVLFMLTGLAFVPVGQLCGRLMARRPNLSAYGLNLIGSLAGIGLMLGMSLVWAPPVAWFGCCLAPLVLFQWFSRRLTMGAAGVSALTLAMLAVPLPRSVERIYSPYQIIQYKTEPVLQIKAAGLYYQRAINLSDATVSRINNPYYSIMKQYYELPYLVKPAPEKVVVLGPGTGNDVAAALRRGAGHVWAVDIDPVLLGLGARYHPEKPYADPRVETIVNDARSFLRRTDETFDVIAYGFIDSYSVLSHSSSVRLDSFVYTVEGLREARARLNENGVMCLAFAGLTPELDGKLYAMMTEAFDGCPPRCVRAGGFPSVAFLQNKEGTLVFPSELIGEDKFEDVTAACAEKAQQADVATDDWPFFYMPRRVYPVSYLGMLALAAVLSVVLVGAFMGRGLRFGSAAFFFLGAGFMLVETKGITELGLTFGNTWQVIGIVIAGVLFMAFLANAVVERFRFANVGVPFTLLLASLALGFAATKGGGFSPTPLGRLTAVALLTCPLFFSGIAFSTLLRATTGIAGAMAMNVLGAMAGGLLEYNAMYFGFRFLYVLAGALYLVALLSTLRPRRASR